MRPRVLRALVVKGKVAELVAFERRPPKRPHLPHRQARGPRRPIAAGDACRSRGPRLSDASALAHFALSQCALAGEEVRSLPRECMRACKLTRHHVKVGGRRREVTAATCKGVRAAVDVTTNKAL